MKSVLSRSTRSHKQHYLLLHQAASFLQQQRGALLKTSIIGSVAFVFGWVAPGSTIPVNSNTSSIKGITQNHQPDAATKARLQEVYSKLPVSFEANQGQIDKQVKFLARGNGYSIFFTPTEAVLTLRQPQTQPAKLNHQAVTKPKPTAKSQTNIIRLQLVGSNPNAQVKGIQQLASKSNYLIGKNSSQWHTDIANYAKVQYQAVYPGIDLVYYGNQKQLEYDFVVAPGANPSSIRFQIKGASRLSLDQQGNLLVHTPQSVIRQHRPRIYQEINGQKKAIAGSYVLQGQQVGFKVAAYNPKQQLIIDPVLSYSTYLGGSSGNGNDAGSGIAVDRRGNIYVTGQTASTDFPTKNALNSTSNSEFNAFVTKFNPNASGEASLVYSTYLGGENGDNGDTGNGIAVDFQGNAYVTGIAYSSDFPTTENAFSRTLSGLSDAFVTKLNATGDRLLYSTYLGGSTASSSESSSADFGRGIAVDRRGNIYLTGEAYSSNFPTTESAFRSKFSGGVNDVFVTKLNPNASGQASLVYSSYLGGSQFDSGFGIAVDFLGNAYITGLTFSGDFPLKNAFDTTFVGGVNDSEAFVTKVNPNASGQASLVYSSYLGGSAEEFGRAIAVDVRGNAYVTGRTSSTDFPTKNAFDSSLKGNQDAFVTKVNPDASGQASLIYSSYLGGGNLVYPDSDEGFGIAVDQKGNAYITGSTSATDFPLKNAFDSTLNGLTDSFVTKLNATGSNLIYSSYLGGNNFDNASAIAVDVRGNAYITGGTTSTDFPTENAFDSNLGGFSDAFVTKISR